jgi:hypothetical protein
MLWKKLWTYRKTGYVVMTITRQPGGKLRIIDSIPCIGKGVVSTQKLPDRLYGPLSRLSRVQADHSVAVKRTGRELSSIVEFEKHKTKSEYGIQYLFLW